MNAHSKLAGHHVVAVALLGGLLFLGSNAASQPATITKTPGPQPTTPAPPSQAPASDVADPSAPADPAAPAQTEFTPTTPPEVAPPPPPPPPPDEPEPVAPRGPFSKGAVRLTLLLGTASTYNDTYFIIGGGVGYYLLNGLEVGLDYEAWLFANPVIQRLSPEARYVFHMVPVLKPYVGTFYRRNFVVGSRRLQPSGSASRRLLHPEIQPDVHWGRRGVRADARLHFERTRRLRFLVSRDLHRRLTLKLLSAMFFERGAQP